MTTATVVRHLTADEVAQRLGIPRFSVYELAKHGLPHLRIGKKRLRFRLADLEAWEAQQVQGSSVKVTAVATK